jgi:DNA-binding PadR family transcriptional regulator
MANKKKMDYAILGLLCHESLTGYEIKIRIDTTLKFFWSASFGSIYPTLNYLVNEGLITKFETTDNGRAKVIYTITSDGKKHLKEWLVLPVTKDELKYETLLKLFFGNEIGPNISLEHVNNFELKIKAELPFLKKANIELKKIQSEEAHRYYLLTAMFGELVYSAYLKWCEEAKKMLK